MVRDGYFYGAGCLLAAGVIAWLATWPYAIPVLLVGAFFLWFFRDPERLVPAAPGMIVSPADGKVTHIESLEVDGQRRTRISIFLNIFDVHVNRSPISGVITDVTYQRGEFLVVLGRRGGISGGIDGGRCIGGDDRCDRRSAARRDIEVIDGVAVRIGGGDQ